MLREESSFQNQMDKLTTDSGKEAAKVTAKDAANDTAKIGDINIEAFAHNWARMIEEGGKVLSAYLKPREEGMVDDGISDQVTEAIKSVGGVAEYWLADPKGAVEKTVSLGRAYLVLVAPGR